PLRGHARLGLRGCQRVDANHLALQIEQRPARVAGVDRRVGLDHVEEIWALATILAWLLNRPAKRAHDTRADSWPPRKCQRVADRNHPVANRKCTSIAKCRKWEIIPGDLYDSKIGVRISAEQLGREDPPIGQRDDKLISALHHMVIRENMTL